MSALSRVIDFTFKREPEPTAPVKQEAEDLDESPFWKALKDRTALKAKNGIKAVLAAQPYGSPLTNAAAMDDDSDSFVPKLLQASQGEMSPLVVEFFTRQGFLGFYTAAQVAQNAFINRACWMPARDAIRNGWNVATVDGKELTEAAASAIKRLDKEMKVKQKCVELVHKGRIFGVRVAIFLVDSDDPEYYEKPFNPDGVTARSYKGIKMVDPYFMTPELDNESASDPMSLSFYEPTYWRCYGKRVHKSHVVVYRHSPPCDILKPVYLYGGIPLPQQIIERLYNAERTANEGPELVMTKRSNVWLTDMEKFLAAGAAGVQRMLDWIALRTNFSVKMGQKDEDEFQQFDTTLADLDNVIMNQYQLVASIAEIPATKYFGIQPKGFNSTGEYEEANYHELLESIQEHDITPLLEGHYVRLLRSEFVNGAEITLEISYPPLDALTGKEQAEINKIKADTAAVLVGAGIISNMDDRKRLATDKDSGYHDLGLDTDKIPELPNETEQEPDQGQAADPERGAGE